MRIFQWFLTSILTSIFIFGGCLVIRYCRERYGIRMSALAISALNCIAPYFCYFATSFEHHHHEGSLQASLYLKLTACLWAFTAIITSIVTSFASTLENDQSSVIPSLFVIYICEMLRTPLIQALDISGNINRHIFGPRASGINQADMNRHFNGASYDLSERYANMTNVLFLAFYYGTIYPAGFFFASATLCINYWTGKSISQAAV